MGKKGDGMPIFNEEMYLYDKNQNSDLFHLHSFGRLYPDADYIISLKENSNTIIECVTDGVGYIEHNGTVTTVEKGDCYIIKQGLISRFNTACSDRFRSFTFSACSIRYFLLNSSHLSLSSSLAPWITS